MNDVGRMPGTQRQIAPLPRYPLYHESARNARSGRIARPSPCPPPRWGGGTRPASVSRITTSPCTDTIEPPCTERYARWCERSAVIHPLLLDSGDAVRLPPLPQAANLEKICRRYMIRGDPQLKESQHRREQVVNVNGLFNVIVHTGLQRSLPVLGKGIG